MKKFKVLYVAGAHRSGTTLLANILNGYDGIFAAGELHEIWQGLIEGDPCGCGRRLELCPVWGPILEEICESALPSPLTPADAVRWRARSAGTWHTGRILRQATRPDRSSSATRYAALMGALYEVIARRTGSRVVIDSTKIPSGAALLLTMNHLTTHVVHLIRDPRATAYSWSKRKVGHLSGYDWTLMEQGPLLSGLQWLGYNLLTEWVSGLGKGEWVRLRYEDLVAHPRAQANALASWLGVETERDPFEQSNVVRRTGNHMIAGNPDRFDTETKRIRLDNRWLTEMGSSDRWIATALSLPLLHRYGYHLTMK
jgi:Sulfotransferase family